MGPITLILVLVFNYILPVGLFCGCQFCIFPEPDKEMIERDFYYYHLENITTDLTSIVTESSSESSNSDSESNVESDDSESDDDSKSISNSDNNSNIDKDINSIENTSNSSSDRLIPPDIEMANR